MSRLPVVLTLGLSAFAWTARAQVASDSGASPAAPTHSGDTPSASVSAPTPAPTPSPPSAISDNAAAMVGRPKFDPPKPEAAQPKPEDDTDLRQVDRPRNQIIRLPNYVVHPPKSPVFREQDFHTKQDELARMALQKYEGLNFMPFSKLNSGVALSLYRDDQRQKTISDLNTAADSVAAGGDKAESDYIKKETQEVFMRPMDFGGFVPMQEQPGR